MPLEIHPELLTLMCSQQGDCRCWTDRANPRATFSVIQKTGVKVCDCCPQVSQVNPKQQCPPTPNAPRNPVPCDGHRSTNPWGRGHWLRGWQGQDSAWGWDSWRPSPKEAERVGGMPLPTVCQMGKHRPREAKWLTPNCPPRALVLAVGSGLFSIIIRPVGCKLGLANWCHLAVFLFEYLVQRRNLQI